MQNWTALYLEISGKIDGIPEIKWIDLWHNQVGFLQDEHPFPTPACFLGFRSNQMKDTGRKVQQVVLQMDVYLFYESFADTYRGSVNQESALGFLNSFNNINALLHGSSGDNYSSMRRVGFAPIDTGGAGNLYQATYECTLVDYSAKKEFDEGSFAEMEINSFSVE